MGMGGHLALKRQQLQAPLAQIAPKLQAKFDLNQELGKQRKYYMTNEPASANLRIEDNYKVEEFEGGKFSTLVSHYSDATTRNLSKHHLPRYIGQSSNTANSPQRCNNVKLQPLNLDIHR